MVSIYCRHCNFKTSVSSTCRWIFLRFPSQTFEELFTFHLECSHAASNCKVSKASTSLWLVKWTIKTMWAFSTISQFSNSFRMWKRSVSRQTILTQSKSCQAPTADFGSLALKKLWIFYTRYLYLERLPLRWLDLPSLFSRRPHSGHLNQASFPSRRAGIR